VSGRIGFVVQGRPLDEIMREIEQHRGSRPNASVTLLYNWVLPAYALERYALDPTAQLLKHCASGATAGPCDRTPIERGSSPPRSDRIGYGSDVCDGALRRSDDPVMDITPPSLKSYASIPSRRDSFPAVILQDLKQLSVGVILHKGVSDIFKILHKMDIVLS
jgi:hypothetical protein